MPVLPLEEKLFFMMNKKTLERPWQPEVFQNTGTEPLVWPLSNKFGKKDQKKFENVWHF